MKYFLCLMGKLCPISSLYKTKLSAMLAATTLFMCLIAAFKAPAQTGAAVNMDEIKPLQIGDTIPEELWHLPLQVVNHPEGKETITLNDYRGKLIILDFWATWCAPCLKAMANMHPLKTKLKKDFVIVPVTKQDAPSTLKTIKTHQQIKELNLMSVYNDKLLQHHFPHNVIPHYSWIDKSGIYLTATNSEEITSNNLDKALEGNFKSSNLKTDRNPNQPLFMLEDVPENTLLSYLVFKKGKYPGYGASTRLRVRDGETVGFAMTNFSLLAIYEAVFKAIAMQTIQPYHPKKLIIDGTYYSELDTGEIKPLNELYSIDIIMPPARYSPVEILKTLNSISGYEGKIDTINMRCFKLISVDGLEGPKTTKSKPENTLFYGNPPSLINGSIANLITRLNDLDQIPYHVYDATGIVDNVDVKFNNDLRFNAIQKSLESQGLKLVEATTESVVFLINKNALGSHKFQM